MKKELSNQEKNEDAQGKYNVLIIGCGGQGSLADAPGSGNEHKVISFAHAFRLHNQTKSICFYDIDKKASKKASNLWDAFSIRDIDSFSLFCAQSASIIVISTPDDSHYEYLLKALKYKPKLVICEKPLCEDMNQAREIVALYKEKNIPLMVNYTRRFIPELRKLRKGYKKGEFGEIIRASNLFNRGMLHTGSHLVDFLIWIFGKKDAKKLVNGTNYIPNDIHYRMWNIQLYFEKYFWQEQRTFDMPVPSYFDNHMKYVVENAYNFLEGKEKLFCTGKDALKALEICYELIVNQNK